jgi:hypothetical protein
MPRKRAAETSARRGSRFCFARKAEATASLLPAGVALVIYGLFGVARPCAEKRRRCRGSRAFAVPQSRVVATCPVRPMTTIAPMRSTVWIVIGVLAAVAAIVVIALVASGGGGSGGGGY